MKSVVNNCQACKSECSTNGAMVVPTFSIDDIYMFSYAIQLQGLTSNTRTVIRIDFVIECDLDCGCWCDVLPDKVVCSCPESATPRETHISQTKKRQRFNILFDPYTVALLANDYYINDDYYTFTVMSVLFEDSLCDILNCEDKSSCYIGTVSGKIGNSYKNRTCEYVKVNCDDGDDETYDRCLPSLTGQDPTCLHTRSNVTLVGYCYYEESGYDCEQTCTSDDNCLLGGLCFEIPGCSVDGIQQEILETANNPEHESGSLTTLKIVGIVGGCVAFVVMMVVVIRKIFYHQHEINEDTMAALQVPLNYN